MMVALSLTFLGKSELNLLYGHSLLIMDTMAMIITLARQFMKSDQSLSLLYVEMNVFHRELLKQLIIDTGRCIYMYLLTQLMYIL